jgi:hypothetical protein
LGYGVYSERVIYQELPSVWKTVSVPENHRLVIKCVTVVNNTTTQALAIVNVHGQLVINDQVPAASSLIRTSLHIVAYERETISVFMYIQNGAVTVHGFLFKDDNPRVVFPPPSAGTLPALPVPAGPLELA